MTSRVLSSYRKLIRVIFPPGTRRLAVYSEAVRRGRLTQRRLTALRRKGGLRPAFEEADLSVSPDEIQLPPPSHPEVSIVIPVYGQLRFTLACLKWIALNTKTPYEVIVVDDASADDSLLVLESIPNLRVVSNPTNVGFTESCNRGASQASGRYLVFLNNDAMVRGGWLEALIRAAKIEENVGIVGAKLVYPDGRLQEAGSIVWNDGIAWNYGRGDHRSKPEYDYVRESDYCSGACLLVRRELFEKLGGFDLRYSPGYYEDTDLAFSARSSGYSVLYQPAAEVVHFEGVSHGTDVSQGIKRHQIINRGKFLDKWRRELTLQHPPNAPRILPLARDRRRGLRVLIGDHHVPTFDQDSGSFRMFQLLQILTEMGCVITFVPNDLAKLEPYTTHLKQRKVEVVYDPVDLKSYLRRLGPFIDVAILSRPQPAGRLLPLVRRFAPQARLIYDTVDLQFLREHRQSQVEKSTTLRRSAEKMRDLELRLFRESDAVIAISESERAFIEQHEPSAKTFVVPNIHQSVPDPAGFKDRRDLLFVGGFVHPPNPDAVTYFVREIFPRIKNEIPEIKFFIAGSNPSKRVKDLASDDVIVTGWAPDLGPYLSRCRVFVSPLRYGAGMKGKIGQALSWGLPVVTSSVGAEGFGFTDGEEVLVADDAADFARLVIKLYSDEALWSKLSEAGRRHVELNYSPAAARARLNELLSKVVGDRAHV